MLAAPRLQPMISAYNSNDNPLSHKESRRRCQYESFVADAALML
jgi:hypothetical protein